MFPKKTKSLPVPPAPRHSFRMRTKDTEIEAHGYGLIVAMMAVILVIAALGFGAILGPTLVSIAKQAAQDEPATPQKPPAP